MSELEALPARATVLLARITRRYQREYETAAAAHGLTVLQAKALLAAVGDAVSMRELASRVYAEPPNVTVVVDRLEALGLVERQADQGDRRVTRIATTALGAVVAGDLSARLPFVTDMLQALTTDQKSLLVELLEVVAAT